MGAQCCEAGASAGASSVRALSVAEHSTDHRHRPPGRAETAQVQPCIALALYAALCAVVHGEYAYPGLLPGHEPAEPMSAMLVLLVSS